MTVKHTTKNDRPREEAPMPQRVIVTGILDEIDNSKRGFRLCLSNGQILRGVLPPGDPRTYRPFFGEKVVVDGEAVFRLSGKVSLLNATNIQIAAPTDTAFEVLPRPRPRSLEDLKPRIPSTPGTSGMEHVFGHWPGTESDDEILAALEAIE